MTTSTYSFRRELPPPPNYFRGHDSLFTYFATHLKGDSQPFAYLGGNGHLHPFRKEWPLHARMATSTYLFKRGLPLLPIYFRWGWQPIYLFWSSLSIDLPTHLSKRRWPPTHISRRRRPSTWQSRSRWQPLPTHLGRDGHLSTYLWKDCHLSAY